MRRLPRVQHQLSCRFEYERLESRQMLATVSLTPDADTYTRSGVSAGNAEVLQVLDNNGGNGDFMAYIRFRLGSLNIDQISSAELTLHKVPGIRNDTIVSSRFDTFGLLDTAGNTPQTWSESTLADSGLGAEFTSTGGDYLDTSRVFNLDQESGANVVETVNNSITAQRLEGADLVSFLNDRVDADGFATFIALIDAGTVRGWGYGSRENSDSSVRPTLEIEFTQNDLPLRQVERLNRGVVAVRQSNSQAYIGWRLFGDDASNIAFNVYRSTNSGAPVLLNASPLTQTTDFVDSTVDLSQDNAYSVRPVIDGVEQAASESFDLEANSTIEQRISIPLQIPAPGPDYTYSANDASVGDVDGDGQYEYILKWDPSNSSDNASNGATGNVYVDAYRLSGELLWRIDLGRNIRAGAHYTQFMVYDFDGDGKSEVITKTAPGTLDGLGNPVLLGSDQVTDDYRNSNGYILSGPEYLTVFSGLTGEELSTIPFEPARGSVSEWGDSYGNRVDRFTAAVAYLDGERPSVVFGRGYYFPQISSGQARNEVAAYDFRDGQLSLRWHFRAGYNINGNINQEYIGQGAHSVTVGDVDGDGRDEIVYGASVIDDNGTGLYSTTLGHGDALHMSDMDPSRPGLEIFMVHEDPSQHGGVGAGLRDAATGELLATIAGSGDIGRGVAADIDPNSPGYEMWATTDQRDIYSAAGEVLYETPENMFYNFVVWWDADLSRELLDRQTVSKWNSPGRTNFDLDPGTSGLQWSAPGASSNNGTKRTPALAADIMGDWREEVIWRRSDSSALDIYTTIIPASNRIYTLMHDTQYRTAIAWQNSGYNQPAHPSFFLGTDMATAPTPQIFFAGETSVVSRGVTYGGATAAYGENAIASDKQPLLPGQTSTAANFTNYSRGLNRVIVQVQDLAVSGLSVSDFEFRVGNTDDPENWTVLDDTSSIPLPEINVSTTEVFGLSDVEFSWPDNAIENSWLQVTVKASDNTGLDQESVFYFGNQIGDVNGDVNSANRIRVNAFDTFRVRQNQTPGGTVGIENLYDIDRSGSVNAFDTFRVRTNQTTGGLLMFTAPMIAPSMGSLVAGSGRELADFGKNFGGSDFGGSDFGQPVVGDTGGQQRRLQSRGVKSKWDVPVMTRNELAKSIEPREVGLEDEREWSRNSSVDTDRSQKTTFVDQFFALADDLLQPTI